MLKASKATNFKYHIVGSLPDHIIQKVNNNESKLTFKEKMAKIHESTCTLEFEKISNAIFSNNIVIIDSQLPCILAHMLLSFYSGFSSKTTELLKLVEESNPLGFDLSREHPFYIYKLKRFFTNLTLGMTPTKVWDGEYNSTEKISITKDDGNVLCFDFDNQNEFENYLIQNTQFETASSSSHDFGSIYKEDDNFYMNLNLQIRFIK